MKNQGRLGQWLQDRCKRERLSLRQVAAKTGLSHATIGDIIKGSHPRPETIMRLTRGFSGDGDGEQRLALEDRLLLLAGYRTPRSEGKEPSEALGQLMDKLKQLNEPQVKMVTRFVDFLIEGGEKEHETTPFIH